MDRLKDLIQSGSSNGEENNIINSVLDEVFIRGLPEDDYSYLVSYCLRSISAPTKNATNLPKEFIVNIAHKLYSFRRNEFNDISLQVISELVSPDINQPVDILATSKELLTVDFLEDVVSVEFSDNVMKILQKLRGKLSLVVLVDIANITQSHSKCLPPPQKHLQFCTEVINQVSSLIVPMSKLVSFMQDVMNIANMIQKVWLTTPHDIVLPCLANIYTLITGSSSPSQSLAAFLNITPKSQIEIALEKLLLLADGLSNSDSQVATLAEVFCDWLIQWPKATNISFWIVSLFKMLTLNGRSSIVAEVLSLKAPKLMEQSIIPVIRASTAPVLPYILLTLRAQPQHIIDPIIKPAIKLVIALKSQQSIDPATTHLLKIELGECLYVLRDTQSCNNHSMQQSLTQILSEIPRPNEQRIRLRLESVPSLNDPKFIKDLRGPTSLANNWLDTRTTTGKIGLINLGNTCYVNSILQALLMNTDFTITVLNTVTTNYQHVLKQLQQVLAFLNYSFRAAYSPASFIKASRPPWFEAGRQQDCSEFLRYLMDSLYEQEKVGRSVLQCDHRWTVGASKEERNKMGHSSELEAEGALQQTNGNLKRWVTEEDLVTETSPPEDTAPLESREQSADSLSNIHSDSTDSGIQSVGDGQEDKEKSSPLEKKGNDQQPSLVHKVFGGKMTTTYRCLACGTESHHQNFFTDLHLAFPDPDAISSSRMTRQLSSQRNDGLSLDSLLTYYFTAEKLQGDNRYHCDHCADLVQEAERILCVTEAPQCLLLTLLRFHYDRLHQRRGKITTQVSYPQLLNLPIQGGSTVRYILYAVVIHSGVTLDGGHYYTLARSSNLTPEDAHGTSSSIVPWFMFNDSQVTRTDFESLISLSRKYATDTPYLLWYRRATDEDIASSYCAPLTSPTLPASLKNMIDEDNAKFLREKFHAVSQLTRTNWAPPKGDDDQDTPRNDSFNDTNGSRFIF